jgi:perosamine synthetase
VLDVKTRIGVGEVRLSQQAILNVNEALANNRLSYGPFTRQFEKRFAALHGRRFAAFVNSGTDALRIGLAAMKERYGWKDGDVVLVPAVTFVASYNVIGQVGLKPMLVDIEPDYYSMDPVQVGQILARHQAAEMPMPVAMMPVHLFGQPASASLHLLANAFGLRVIADSCETAFVPNCAMGDVSCFSTYACHLINTGVGGLATTNDPILARLIRSLANHGRDGIYTGIDEELGNLEVIEARFRFERPGYSSRVTEMEAGIGCAELDVWEDNIAARQSNAALLTQALSNLPLVLPKVRKGSQSANMMYPVRAQDQVVRDALVQHLESEGIETRYCLPLTSQPYIDCEDRYPVAKMVNETSFYVPCHQHLSLEDVGRISDAFHSFWR